MTRLALAALVAVILAGCEDREVARARNEQRLPAGCKIIDLDYGDLRVAVVCEGRKTTTSIRSWNETTYYYDASLKQMMPITTHYTSANAEIGELKD